MHFLKLSATAAAVLAASNALAFAADAPGPLVDAQWLSDHLDDAQVQIIDLRGGDENPYAAGHIPGAISAPYGSSGWRAQMDGVIGMLPPVADLEALIGGLGIDNDTHVVLVPFGENTSDFGAATRVYWTFNVLGHEAVSILDGGHAGWVSAGLALETEAATPEAATFVADLQEDMLVSDEDIAAAMADGVTLIDARPQEQFIGDAAHPQASRPGTIPGSINFPHSVAFGDGGNAVQPADTLNQLYNLAAPAAAPEGPAIAFCNTGHWASVAWFVGSEVMGRDVQMYDASMVGWTANPDNPVVNGE